MLAPVTALVTLFALSSAAPLHGVVSKVTDGDTVSVKIGKATKSFGLAGLDAPELSACFGTQAKTKLSRLLGRGKAVKLTRNGRAAVILTGRTNVNRAMVQGGFAKANASGGGKLGTQLRADQAAAQGAGRGLWTACKAPEPTPQQGDVTGQEAIDRMTNELKGGRWRYFTSSSQSSTEYILNLCADGTFLRTGEAVGVLVYKYGTWRVTDAVIKGDGSGRAATVTATITQGDPPPDGSDYVTNLGVVSDQWYWGENAAQYFPGAAQCS